ncbi:type I restriction-modification system subunit M [Microbulbifer elongatus]|uniref:class I SAM-dependent DNA methyltransferase n=1 Tax=Microbulbifer elongatus TaxID=86173 RepID=UPI001CFF121D|nr:class I SAM-dependent DNA methyltransferase [Microbulbifer elongatus]
MDKKKAAKQTSSLANIEKTLWAAADKLRSNMDAAEYKHVVLGLIFLKYISDSFDEFRSQLTARIQDPEDELYWEDATDEDIAGELEDRDHYLAANIFWVPAEARWGSIQAKAREADIGRTIDNAMAAIEKENPRLKGILNREYGRERMKQVRLGELIDLIATIGFNDTEHRAKDVLGHVYEYFLGQFASAEGKKGGQFYTPKSIVSLIVEMLEPYKGRVYDPAMGSGGFFVSSEKFIESHGGKLGDISIYGQESNPTTWRLAAMNMAIRGMDFNFGKEPADSFHNDQHPDLKADYVMANPPFNISDWGGDALEADKRWQFGTPPAGNANFAWVQHMLHHLAPNGRAGIVLANGSMSSNTNNEGAIRKALVEADLVECMVALPGQLFTNTQIPACIWFLARNKPRQGEILFIDARIKGEMASRVLKEFSSEDITAIVDVYHQWRNGDAKYHDEPGFVKSAALEEIRGHEHVLTPGRYVGAADEDDDGVPFAAKIAGLTGQLTTQFKRGHELESAIKAQLGGLGFEF